MVVKIMPNEKGTPSGKLADAEVHFIEGELQGLRLLGFAVLLRNSLALGLYGMDDFLLRMPVFGIVYEVLLRKETYYREDSRVMFMDLVRALIEARTDEFTSAKGFEQKPFVDAAPDLHRQLADLLKKPRPSA